MEWVESQEKYARKGKNQDAVRPLAALRIGSVNGITVVHFI